MRSIIQRVGFWEARKAADSQEESLFPAPRRLEPTLSSSLSSRIAVAATFLLLFILCMHWLGGSKSRFAGGSGATYAPPPPPAAAAFTVGSTKHEVETVQGSPSNCESNVWHYGSSRVRFRMGRVVGWNNSSKDPLKVTMTPSETTKGIAGIAFKIGSTKDEVLAAQGVPTRLDDEIWQYGKSIVEFRDDRVIAWHSTPSNPLKVEKPPRHSVKAATV